MMRQKLKGLQISFIIFLLQSCINDEILELNGIIVVSYKLLNNNTAVCVDSVQYVDNNNLSYFIDGMIVDNTNYPKPSFNFEPERGSLENSLHCQDNLRNRYYFSGGDKYREVGGDTLTFKVIFNIKGSAAIVAVSPKIEPEKDKSEEEDFDYRGCPRNNIEDNYLILLEGFETSILTQKQIDSMRLQKVEYDRLIRFNMS